MYCFPNKKIRYYIIITWPENKYYVKYLLILFWQKASNKCLFISMYEENTILITIIKTIITLRFIRNMIIGNEIRLWNNI